MSTPIIDFLREHNVPLMEGGKHHHVRLGFVGVHCPYCGSKKWHRAIATHSQPFTRCWRCGKGKGLVDLLCRLTGERWGVCKAVVDGAWGIRAKIDRPVGHLRLPAGVGPLLDCHHEYLRSRRFNPDTIQRLWDVRGIGMATRYAWSLFLPFINQGEVASWTTRAIGVAVKRYDNAPVEWERLPRNELLYGIDYVRHAAVIVEGPTDVWRIGPGACATCGLKYSTTQVLRLSRVPVRVVAFDAEPSAQRIADDLCSSLAPFPGVTHRVELDEGDPGDASPREIQRIRRLFLK